MTTFARSAVVGWVLLSACESGSGAAPDMDVAPEADADTDADADADVDADTDTDTEAPEPFEAVYWAVLGGFGYLPETDAVTATGPNASSLQPPWVSIVLFEEEYLSGSDTSHTCDVLIQWAGAEPPAFTMLQGDTVTHGGFVFDLAADPLEVTNRCPPLVGPLEEFGSAWDWARASYTELGVGVGEASQESMDVLANYIDPADRVWYGGAGFWVADTSGYATYAAYAGAVGYAIEPDGTLARDDDGFAIQLPATAFTHPSGVPTAAGYYQSTMFYLFAF